MEAVSGRINNYGAYIIAATIVVVATQAVVSAYSGVLQQPPLPQDCPIAGDDENARVKTANATEMRLSLCAILRASKLARQSRGSGVPAQYSLSLINCRFTPVRFCGRHRAISMPRPLDVNDRLTCYEIGTELLNPDESETVRVCRAREIWFHNFHF
jgi:hypothetical protein